MFRRMIDFISQHVIHFQGSTRPIALIRIGLVFLMWNRWAKEFALFHYPYYRQTEISQVWVGIPFFVFSLFMLIGFWTRLSTFIVSLCLLFTYYYIGFVVGMEPYIHHHIYALAIMTCLLALTPCGRSLSLDRWIAIRRAERLGIALPSEIGPLWATRLMALQIAIIYFWSAVSKSNIVFLSGERLEAIFMYLYFGSDYPTNFPFQLICVGLAVATLIIEYALAFTLWLPRLRNISIISAILFHLLLYYVTPLKTFSLTMCLCLIVFIRPSSVDRVITKLFSPSKSA